MEKTVVNQSNVRKTDLVSMLKKNAMLIILVLVYIFFTAMTGGRMFRPNSFASLINQNAYVYILGCGMLMCMLTGGNIDLSCGAFVCLVGAMGEAMGNVHTAMVTYAARDSDFDGHAIHAGEYLALLDGQLIGSYTNTKTLFKELSWAIDDFRPEFITVYYGEDVTEEEATAAAETMVGNFPDADVNVVDGGQPVYYYMISAE